MDYYINSENHQTTTNANISSPSIEKVITKCSISPEKTFTNDLQYLREIEQLKTDIPSFTEEYILGNLKYEEQHHSSNVDSMFNYSTDVESGHSGDINDYDFDIKPDILNTEIDNNGSLNEGYIKMEVEDVDVSQYSINTEITVKNEPDENISNESLMMPSLLSESTEAFLARNPETFTKFCGLPDFNMFKALFNFIEDDVRQIHEATKFEQLFSVLAKLHKNEDNLYLNKYLFPATFVYIVELLYERLGLLCRNIKTVGIPDVFIPVFDESQRVIIIGITCVSIRNTSSIPIKCNYVKYLIGYTGFGDVFFVSKQFPETTSNRRLLHNCGVLNRLQKDWWILLAEGENIFVKQVGELSVKRSIYKDELYSKSIQRYTLQVVRRLALQFKILQSQIPDFMLYKTDKGKCFLDQLVFVCCMLLNMLPRCAYK